MRVRCEALPLLPAAEGCDLSEWARRCAGAVAVVCADGKMRAAAAAAAPRAGASGCLRGKLVQVRRGDVEVQVMQGRGDQSHRLPGRLPARYNSVETCDDCTGVCTKSPKVVEEDLNALVAHVEIFAYDLTTDTLVRPALARLPIGGPCDQALAFNGSTAPARFNATWVVAVVSLDNASAPLANVELTVHYEHSGEPVARPPSPLPPVPPCQPAPNATKCDESWNCGVCKWARATRPIASCATRVLCSATRQYTQAICLLVRVRTYI